MTKHTEEFSHLPFSQREGIVPLPDPLQLGELSDDLRRELADYYFYIVENNKDSYGSYFRINKVLMHVIAEFQGISLRRLDEERRSHYILNFCESAFLGNKIYFRGKAGVANYNMILDFLELCLNKSTRFDGNVIQNLFKKHQAAYTLVYFENKEHWNFHPITSEANQQAVQRDLGAVEMAGYERAVHYFITASEAIREGDFNQAIVASHSATEAIARDITDESSLGDAFKKLRKDSEIDNILVNGMEKITAYAHQYRHGGKPKSAKVSAGQDESILMFSINAAISGYLATKAKGSAE